MEVLYLLIPIALLLVGVMIVAFFWAVKSGQFDDLEGPAYQILMDEDDIEDTVPNTTTTEATTKKTPERQNDAEQGK